MEADGDERVTGNVHREDQEDEAQEDNDHGASDAESAESYSGEEGEEEERSRETSVSELRDDTVVDTAAAEPKRPVVVVVANRPEAPGPAHGNRCLAGLSMARDAPRPLQAVRKLSCDEAITLSSGDRMKRLQGAAGPGVRFQLVDRASHGNRLLLISGPRQAAVEAAQAAVARVLDKFSPLVLSLAARDVDELQRRHCSASADVERRTGCRVLVEEKLILGRGGRRVVRLLGDQAQQARAIALLTEFCAEPVVPFEGHVVPSTQIGTPPPELAQTMTPRFDAVARGACVELADGGVVARRSGCDGDGRKPPDHCVVAVAGPLLLGAHPFKGAQLRLRIRKTAERGCLCRGATRFALTTVIPRAPSPDSLLLGPPWSWSLGRGAFRGPSARPTPLTRAHFDRSLEVGDEVVLAVNRDGTDFSVFRWRKMAPREEVAEMPPVNVAPEGESAALGESMQEKELLAAPGSLPSPTTAPQGTLLTGRKDSNVSKASATMVSPSGQTRLRSKSGLTSVASGTSVASDFEADEDIEEATITVEQDGGVWQNLVQWRIWRPPEDARAASAAGRLELEQVAEEEGGDLLADQDASEVSVHQEQQQEHEQDQEDGKAAALEDSVAGSKAESLGAAEGRGPLPDPQQELYVMVELAGRVLEVELLPVGQGVPRELLIPTCAEGDVLGEDDTEATEEKGLSVTIFGEPVDE
eukprot:TRINITY_DN22339_c0_g1_i1.p1 TRINITY_DN22339_c0_g1~~TRINITY_DN22339_c0_g1_i1.p1  ORF type:complete len:700 (-),score=149.88 TRINITY_DN22339_c0_g1_i1:67-2166(-)